MAMPPDVGLLYVQIRRRLLETGEWDQIRNLMSAKLNESGWNDDAHHLSREMAKSMDDLSFKLLLAEFAPRAEASVPLAVKREMSNAIRQHVEKQFE